MKIIKGLFFDLDGTLVDTVEANYQAYSKAVAGIGRKFDREIYETTFGMHVSKFMRMAFPDISEQEIEEVKKLKAAYYPDFLHLARPHRQLIDFVETLRPNHTTVLVTMAQRQNAMAVLHATKLENMFDFVITGNDIEQHKPHPEPYLKALDLTGLAADEVLAFEDSESGIEAAKAAGISILTISIPES